jgi:hypothetical protein
VPRPNIKESANFNLVVRVKQAEESLRIAYGETLSGGVPDNVAASVRKAWDGSRSVLEAIRVASVPDGKIVPFPGKRLKRKR